MTDSSKELNRLLKYYKRTKKPISVNFRELVPEITSPDFYTHIIHPYPAKLLPHIPRFFLSNEILSQKKDIVLDPFSGSGTVLLESILQARNAIGADCNPMARLISQVKVKYLSTSILLGACRTEIFMIHKSKIFYYSAHNCNT
jgi:DNA modification methylase